MKNRKKTNENICFIKIPEELKNIRRIKCLSFSAIGKSPGK